MKQAQIFKIKSLEIFEGKIDEKWDEADNFAIFLRISYLYLLMKIGSGYLQTDNFKG